MEGIKMSFLMILRVAIKALGRNKLRTGLTMLGMIIGVAAVITMVALGTGAQSSIEEQIKSAGTNMVTISAGSFTSGGVRHGWNSATSLTQGDARAIREQVTGVMLQLGSTCEPKPSRVAKIGPLASKVQTLNTP